MSLEIIFNKFDNLVEKNPNLFYPMDYLIGAPLDFILRKFKQRAEKYPDRMDPLLYLFGFTYLAGFFSIAVFGMYWIL